MVEIELEISPGPLGELQAAFMKYLLSCSKEEFNEFCSRIGEREPQKEGIKIIQSKDN